MNDDGFAQIRSVGEAAAAIVDDDRLGSRREVLLVKLVERAQHELVGDSWTLGVVRNSIWREAKPYLAPDRQLPWEDKVTSACRQLRSEGRQSCPNCLRPLPSIEVLEVWAAWARKGLARAVSGAAP